MIFFDKRQRREWAQTEICDSLDRSRFACQAAVARAVVHKRSNSTSSKNPAMEIEKDWKSPPKLSSTASYVMEDSEKKKHHLSFAQLQFIDGRRRQILQQTNLSFGRILGHIDGTCLATIATDWLLWLTLAIFVGLRLYLRNMYGDEDEVDDYRHKMEANVDVNILGNFLSFFLVLFVNQSNARFQEMYKTSQKCSRVILDMVQLLGRARVAGQVSRHLNAAHVAAYVGLSQTYSKVNFFDPLNDFHGFLTATQSHRLQHIHDMDHGPAVFHELVQLVMRDLEGAVEQNLLEASKLGAMQGKVTQFRESMDELYSLHDQPIHFFYLHFLCLLTVLYLPLFAADGAYDAGFGYDTDWSLELLAGLIVLVQAVFVIGLRDLGQVRTETPEILCWSNSPR